MSEPLTDEDALSEYRTELARIRSLFRKWADSVEPPNGYSGAHIRHMVNSILADQ